MSGEFLGRDPHQVISVQDIRTNTDDKFRTDVPDVMSDGQKVIGNEKFPIFHVSHDEFFGNQRAERRRQRYKSGSPVQQYVSRTKNSGRPFFIQTTDANGKKYERKIR